MMARRAAISVRLDDAVQEQVERAARLVNETPAAFLQRAGAETARQVLLAWAVRTYRNGERTLSQLAEETGLGVEDIIDAQSRADREGALDFYLAAARTAARLLHDDSYLRFAETAVNDLRHVE
jgi:predicted transcriptional regulator